MEKRESYMLKHVVAGTIALCVGAFIVLILTALNHGGWFALLSGLFGAVLSYAWSILRILLGSRAEELRFHPKAGGDVEMQAQVPSQAKIMVVAYGSLIFFSLLGIAAFVGLYVIPSQSSYVLLSAILGVVLCICLLSIVVALLGLLLRKKKE